MKNRDTMILLGSVERTELIKIIAKQISSEKRLQVAAQWQKEVQDIRSREKDEFNEQNTILSPSLIEVTSVDTVANINEFTNNEALPPHPQSRDGNCILSPGVKNVELVKRNSTGRRISLVNTNSRLRSTFDAIFTNDKQSVRAYEYFTLFRNSLIL